VIDNPAVKSVLKGISLDSVKHAEMYEAVKKLLEKVLPPLITKRYMGRGNSLRNT